MKFVVDSSVFATAFVASETNSDAARRFFHSSIQNNDEFIIPLTVFVESIIAVSRRTNETLADELKSFILGLPNARLVELDIVAARESIETGIKLGLKGMDSIVVALAASFEATLVTLDREMIERSRGFVAVHPLV